MKDDEKRHGSYVQKVSDDTRRYVQELLAENEKLRSLLTSLGGARAARDQRAGAPQEAERANEALRALAATLEAEKERLKGRLLSAREELERFRNDQAELERRLAAVEEENRSFSEQYARVEQETSNLANLYVASYRLHGTVDRGEVLAVIQEIVANLIGCEELAVFELEAAASTLSLLAWNGIDPDPYQAVPQGSGVIGGAALHHEVRVVDAATRESLPPSERCLTACIPLKLGDDVIGVIALFRLLPHKERIEAVDRELFELLATHAATALYCSGLHARLEAGTTASGRAR